ncbi:sugar transferase [Listeria sp. SHR_NRA_18]|uniref:sugar transferase n=1 Tax=Listeria sp. SHR_NRA_18 TaxID=2269046 RepID=UPI00051D2D7E|nr:sugar transferase [Listeria sp. SHR_NRA_18]KGL39143.1 hypothetical protein EP56_14640 [Listeriaceae bacterium FSL A5-0209]RQW66364.1 sugar transferase [Listeria sp. SHR_NRA_18]
MYLKTRRLCDIIIALSVLLLLIIPMFTIACLSKIFIGNTLFKQARVGKDERIFVIYKFATMKDLRDKTGNLLPDEERMSRFGRYLRKSSLDELPQFFNILKGDMSLIGPRPLLVSYLDLYTAEQRKRHAILPGLTGWAQVNGRNAISWEEKFRLDTYYVENVSFLIDLQIIFKTIQKILVSEGISKQGYATTSVFEKTTNN